MQHLLGPEEGARFLVHGVTGPVRVLMWVVGSELGSSAKVANILNPLPALNISPALVFYFI